MNTLADFLGIIFKKVNVDIADEKFKDVVTKASAININGHEFSGIIHQFESGTKGVAIKHFAKHFEEWARKNGKIFPELVTFLMHNKDLFHQLDVEKEVKNFPSPRSWSDSALQIYDEVQDERVNSWRDLPDSTISNIFYDNVGPFAAGKISDYLNIS